MNALPATTLIAETIAELARAAQAAGDTANMNALNKAALQVNKGVEVAVDLASGDLLIPSRSDEGAVYRVSATLGCSCKAGMNQRACWHAALAEAIAVASEAVAAAPDAVTTEIPVEFYDADRDQAEPAPIGGELGFWTDRPARSEIVADMPDYIAELYPDGI